MAPCFQPGETTADFTGVEALFDLFSSRDTPLNGNIDAVVTSGAYQAFLGHHAQRLDEESLRNELLGLVQRDPTKLRILQHWQQAVEAPDRLNEAVQRLRSEWKATASELSQLTFDWLPLMYGRPATIYFLLDGMSSGYRSEHGWSCDLMSIYTSPDSANGIIRSQLFHALYGKEMEFHLGQLWSRYREKCDTPMLLYELWVLVELLRGGVPLFLKRQLGIVPKTSCDACSEHVLQNAYDRLAAFMMCLRQSDDPTAYFNNNRASLYDGPLHVFQLVGAHMSERIAKQAGREELVKCLSNPVDFWIHFAEASERRHETNRFTPPLVFIGPGEASCGRSLVDCDWHAWSQPEGGRIIWAEHEGPLRFCILVRGAGAVSDRSYGPGTAHLVEHYKLQAIGRSTSDLSLLKGTTDHHHCLYYGESNLLSCRVIDRVLDALLHEQTVDLRTLEAVRPDVLAEIESVSSNPLYLTQEWLCQLLVADAGPIRGRSTDIEAITASTAASFIRDRYGSAHIVMAMAGRGADEITGRLIDRFGSERPCGQTEATAYVPRDDAAPMHWERHDASHVTCSFGFCLFPSRELSHFEQTLLSQYIDRYLQQSIANSERRITLFTEVRSYGTFAAVMVNLQCGVRDLDDATTVLTETLRSNILDEVGDVLGPLGATCQKQQRDLLIEDHMGFLGQLVQSNVRQEQLSSTDLTIPGRELPVDAIWLRDQIREAFGTERLSVAGMGPVMPRLNCLED